MRRWPEVPLQEVAHLTRGTEPGSESYTNASRGIRFLRVGDITGKTDRPIFTDSNQLVMVDRNDVLIALDGTPGYVSTGHAGAISSGIRKVEPKKTGKVSLEWLRYTLMSPDVQATIKRHTNGVTILHASSAVPHIRIPIPPIHVQEYFVQLLSEAEALCRLRIHANEHTDKIIAGFYNNIFTQNSERRSWEVHSIEALATKKNAAIRTGPFGSQLLHSEFVDKGVPVIGIDNVVENEFRWSTSRCIPREKFEKFLRFQIFPGDVLITIMGTVGKCCVAPDDLPLCMSTKHLCVITPNRDLIHPRYLWAALIYDYEVRKQTRAVGSGAIMEGWNSTIIKQLKLRIPPIVLQHEFAYRVAEICMLQKAQAGCWGRLSDLLKSLLHRAFQGAL